MPKSLYILHRSEDRKSRGRGGSASGFGGGGHHQGRRAHQRVHDAAQRGPSLLRLGSRLTPRPSAEFAPVVHKPRVVGMPKHTERLRAQRIGRLLYDGVKGSFPKGWGWPHVSREDLKFEAISSVTLTLVQVTN